MIVDKTLAQKYRARAREQLNEARSLLDRENRSLPFVCLKLRQCIESLSYGLLVLYRHELTKSAMMSWTPQRVLKELQAVDPDANRSHTLSIGIPGVGGSTESILISGEDRRFSPRWASVAYNKLSSFLHVPTPKTIESNSEPSADKIRDQCCEYLAELDRVFATEVWHFVSGRFVDIPCECGFAMKRRLETINVGSVFECAECGRMFDVLSIDETKVGVVLRVARMVCKSCKTETVLGAHELEEGKQLSCRNCSATITLRRVWSFSQESSCAPE